MKRFLAGIIFVAAALTTVGWGSTYGDRDDKDAGHVHDYDNSHQRDRDKGDRQADKDRQGNDEDIKRAQGDASGRRDVNDQGSLQNDDRGKF